MKSSLGVVGDERGRETVVLLQPLLQNLGVVVIPPDQGLPGDVILARHSGWVELLVVGAPTRKMKPTATDSSNYSHMRGW